MKHITRIVLATVLSLAAFPVAKAATAQPQAAQVPCHTLKKHGWLHRFIANEKARAEQMAQAEENKAGGKVSKHTGGTVAPSALPPVPAIPDLQSQPCTPVKKAKNK